jgi:hypothetical protein
MHEKNTTGGFQTGDINLASALMACGVPLSPDDPVTLIQPESGKPYGSFRLREMTMDGRDSTMDLMLVWGGKKRLAPSHGFEVICQFLRSRPADCRSTNDLLDFAMEYLVTLGMPCAGVRTLADVPRWVAAKPTSADSFILAFIHCREQLFRHFQKSKTDHYLTRGSGNEARHAMISNNLPRWQRRELTSRLQG